MPKRGHSQGCTGIPLKLLPVPKIWCRFPFNIHDQIPSSAVRFKKRRKLHGAVLTSNSAELLLWPLIVLFSPLGTKRVRDLGIGNTCFWEWIINFNFEVCHNFLVVSRPVVFGLWERKSNWLVSNSEQIPHPAKEHLNLIMSGQDYKATWENEHN